MTAQSPRRDTGLAREIFVVVAMTLVGGALRIWSPGRIGMVHFDEGIYALTGLWVYSPRGLLDLDPTSIAYAPPGFAVLVGVSYLGLGVGDFPAILVSIIAGTLTIPATAWVARRTFGSGSGAAAAAFAALSGPHVAFSRMALTDASFLLFWVLAIGQGQRFLQRPNPARAVWLGLTVGLAQLFKYNGWISGGIVALSAALWLIGRPRERRSTAAIATWGWGLAAALVAAAAYWPWFQFVESHGGYGALLAHERSYLGRLASWPSHLSVQLAQAGALTGGPIWLASGGLAAAIGMLISSGDFTIERKFLPRTLAQALYLTIFCLWLLPNLVWLYIFLWICFMLMVRRNEVTEAMFVLGVGWAVLALLTPFYHPYARLWLPLEAFGWLFLSSLFVSVRSTCAVPGRGAGRAWTWPGDPLLRFGLYGVLGTAIHVLAPDWSWKGRSPGLLDPSDSVRQACGRLLSELPKDLGAIRVFARPPVAFYLGMHGRAAVIREPDAARLLQPGDPTAWAALDMALIRQAHAEANDFDPLLAGWATVREFPTTLNLPTLLDIDPAAAGRTDVDSSASLRLLRPVRRTVQGP
jgi:hypothetical protein